MNNALRVGDRVRSVTGNVGTVVGMIAVGETGNDLYAVRFGDVTVDYRRADLERIPWCAEDVPAALVDAVAIPSSVLHATADLDFFAELSGALLSIVSGVSVADPGDGDALDRVLDLLERVMGGQPVSTSEVADLEFGPDAETDHNVAVELGMLDERVDNVEDTLAELRASIAAQGEALDRIAQRLAGGDA